MERPTYQDLIQTLIKILRSETASEEVKNEAEKTIMDVAKNLDKEYDVLQMLAKK